MAKRKVSIEDVLEINARMVGYHGWDITFGNGFMGQHLDLELAQILGDIITEVINKKDRDEFSYFPSEKKNELWD